MKLKIVAISDLDGNSPDIIESADIALIPGDIVPLAVQFNNPGSKEWLETTFANWVNNLPVDAVFLTAGNHDAYFESITNTKLQSFLSKCNGKLKYLKNETVTYFDENGLDWTIFGTPYCHIYGNWPFMRSDEYMTEKFKEIPDKVDIIMSHDPPFAVSDVDVILDSSRRPILDYKHLGNPPLANRINNVNYKLLVCGHIHGGDHQYDSWWKTVNVSYLNEGYRPHYKPFYTEIEHDL